MEKSGNRAIAGDRCIPVETRLLCDDDVMPGMAFSYYEGSWRGLPDFRGLEPVLTGRTTRLSLDPAKRRDRFALVFRGFVEIVRAGEYTFFTTSDDGSRLYVRDRLIVDNDGLHGPKTASGKIALKRGKHAICVEFFEGGGGEKLEVEWLGPGFRKQRIPEGVLWCLKDTPSGEK